MEIKTQPMGAYHTNCYLVTVEGKTLIIDPGQDATEWVLQHAQNPVAILNTHGHFDHVWSNGALQKRLDIPVYVPDEDAFMLENDPFGQGTPPSHPDVRIRGDEAVTIAGIPVRVRHFPGHTPGNAVIEIGGHWFSGDFLFYRSIGRWDFPYSSGSDMIRSLQKAQQIETDYPVHPGHGPETTLAAEQKHIPYWIETVKASI
jgi:glyoxylase-like metal-dependent hydrolase (beta-lactamase superfamily II)